MSTIGTTNTPSFVEIREVTLQFLGDLAWNDPQGSVSCGPSIRRTTPSVLLTGRKKTQFSHLCSSVIPNPIGTKFARGMPAS